MADDGVEGGWLGMLILVYNNHAGMRFPARYSSQTYLILSNTSYLTPRLTNCKDHTMFVYCNPLRILHCSPFR